MKSKLIKKPKVGNSYLINTFAGIQVPVRICSIIDYKNKVYGAKLLNFDDLKKFKSAGVPVENKHFKEQFAVFDFHIIKGFRKKRKQK